MAADCSWIKSQDGHIFDFKLQVKRLINEFSSPQFSAGAHCDVKWNILLKETKKRIDFGLRRKDSIKFRKRLFASCIVEILTRGHAVLKTQKFEGLFSSGESRYLPNEDTAGYEVDYDIEDAHYIVGKVMIYHCCQRKEDKLHIDDNITQLQKDFEAHMKIHDDVTLTVNNEIIQAHKFVLSARSPVFKRMFERAMKDNRQGSVRIEDIDKEVFEAFLTYLYTGVVEDNDFKTVFELYSIADKYEVKTLQNTCRCLLVSYLSHSTVSSMLKLADLHCDDKLKDAAVKYICSNSSSVLSSVEWDKLLETDPRLASLTLKRVSTNIAK